MEKRLAQSLQYPSHKYASCFGNNFRFKSSTISINFNPLYAYIPVYVNIGYSTAFTATKYLEQQVCLSMFDLLVAPNAVEY